MLYVINSICIYIYIYVCVRACEDYFFFLFFSIGRLFSQVSLVCLLSEINRQQQQSAIDYITSKRKNCTPSPHYPAGSVISYLCSADLSHTKQGYLWNLIAEVCRFIRTYSLRHASGWPALWSVASAWIWGMRWLMFSIDECWRRHSAKSVRRSAEEEGCSWPRYDRQQPVPSGGGNNMGITGARPGLCSIPLHSTVCFVNIRVMWEFCQSTKEVQIIIENITTLDYSMVVLHVWWVYGYLYKFIHVDMLFCSSWW